MLNDLLYIYIWWLILLMIGWLLFPFTSLIFKKFFDKGYLFSKVVGILFSSYFVWLLASLKILSFSRGNIIMVLAALLAGNILVFRKLKNKTGISRSLLPILVGEELMFLLCLTAWSYVRGFQPNIQGLEKFMDFGFVNSILRSKFFPPADMWFAGESINYYYFGHFITAFLTKLSGIDSAITYNLMMATLFSFTFSLAFSISGNLIYLINSKKDVLKWILIGGLTSALLISLGANLHPVYYNVKMDIFKKPYCDGSFFYWYPNATRYIGYCPNVEDKTIHEFPSYSFIVSDLHGHVSDIPFVLLFLAMTFNLYLYLKEKPKKFLTPKILPLILPMSLILAIMYMTNQWDFPIYILVLGLTLLASYFQKNKFNQKTFLNIILLGVLTIIFSIPFFALFQKNSSPIIQGIGLVRAHSLPHQLFILWGAFWLFGFALLAYILVKENIFKKKIREIFSRLPATDVFILILFLTSTILIIIPEIIYVKDIYIPSYHRANTMFKLTYQSFIMFCLGSGYAVSRIFSSLKKGVMQFFLRFAFCVLFLALMIFPFYSIEGYYGKIVPENYKGLYGLKFMQNSYPDDFAAILWLNKNVKDQPVVLEAVGDSYTDYERISMATGLPTIQGWLVHEWLWRGGYEQPGKRSTEVGQIYESDDVDLTKKLLREYKVKYIIVGKMEQEKYPNLKLEKISSLGEKVFESGETKIFSLNSL